jgi:hypothetical protein
MLSRDIILSAFTRLSHELGKAGVLGELNIVGGTAMVLAFNARTSTKDVDAIFEPSVEVRNAAAIVASALELPMDWLNDAVKGFLSPVGDFSPLPSIDLPNLRVQAPTPEYMLAMKVLAARAGVESEHGDASDIAFLIRFLRLADADSVLDIVGRYYDPSRLLPRSIYLVDEIIERLSKE